MQYIHNKYDLSHYYCMFILAIVRAVQTMTLAEAVDKGVIQLLNLTDSNQGSKAHMIDSSSPRPPHSVSNVRSQTLPRRHSPGSCSSCNSNGNSMRQAFWNTLNRALLLLTSTQLCLWSVSAAADEPTGEVKIEVVFKPEECSQSSKKGDLMNAHYDGYLAENGHQFYCSRSEKAGHPQWFVLGVGQVIKGLDIGMMNMCPGEKRKITVPPELAFGEKGKEPVPPNATVIFEVEVYAVSRGPRSVDAFKEVDQDADKVLTRTEVKEHLKLSYEKGGKVHDDLYYEKILDDIFYKSDRDKDGMISAKEYNIYEHDEL